MRPEERKRLFALVLDALYDKYVNGEVPDEVEKEVRRAVMEAVSGERSDLITAELGSRVLGDGVGKRSDGDTR